MSMLERLGATLTVTAALSGFGSQAPEVFACEDEAGRNATEWIGGDITVPHCDEEYMSDTANVLHDGGKLVAIITGSGALACAVVVSAQDRRRGAVPQSSGNL